MKLAWICLRQLCRSTPHIAKMNPAAAPNVPDFHQAGGVSAVMKELLPILHGDALTVTGKTIAENRCRRGGTRPCDYQNDRGSLE